MSGHYRQTAAARQELSVYSRVQHTQRKVATVWVLPVEVGAAGSLWVKARHLWARHW